MALNVLTGSFCHNQKKCGTEGVILHSGTVVDNSFGFCKIIIRIVVALCRQVGVRSSNPKLLRGFPANYNVKFLFAAVTNRGCSRRQMHDALDRSCSLVREATRSSYNLQVGTFPAPALRIL